MNVPADRLPTRRSALATLVAAAALGAQPAAAQGAPIRLGTSVDDASMQSFFAQDLGLFKKADLDVDITTFTNSASVAEAMAGGAIDVGLMDPTQTALASIARSAVCVLRRRPGLHDVEPDAAAVREQHRSAANGQGSRREDDRRRHRPLVSRCEHSGVAQSQRRQSRTRQVLRNALSAHVCGAHARNG